MVKSLAVERLAARPSTTRYQALLNELGSIDRRLANGDDKLQLAAAAVHAVTQFLSEDQYVKTHGTGAALRMLFDQLGDAYVGSKQTIFIKNIPRGFRPSLAADAHRGMMVFALDILIKAKMGNPAAAKYLRGLLKDAGVTYRGKAVTSALLLTWREQIGDSSPPAATDMMGGLGRNMPVSINSIDEAKLAAAGLVEALARRNSN